MPLVFDRRARLRQMIEFKRSTRVRIAVGPSQQHAQGAALPASYEPKLGAKPYDVLGSRLLLLSQLDAADGSLRPPVIRQRHADHKTYGSSGACFSEPPLSAEPLCLAMLGMCAPRSNRFVRLELYDGDSLAVR